MKYKYVLFDLDGTVIDSGSGVIASVKYALKKCERQIPDDSLLKKFIGPPLDYSFENYIGMSRSEVESAVAFYREYYKDKGIFDCLAYDGIGQIAAQLKERGFVTLIATSKPEVFAKRVIERLGLSDCFDYVVGALLDDTRKTKEQVISYALELVGCDSPKTSAIMVGDRLYDIEGAHAHGMKCIAVLYGYGGADEFVRYGADYIVESPRDIAELLGCAEK